MTEPFLYSDVTYDVGESSTFVAAAVSINKSFGNGVFEILRCGLAGAGTDAHLMQIAYIYEGTDLPTTGHVDVLASGYGDTINNLVTKGDIIKGPGYLRFRRYTTGSLNYRLTYRRVI